MRPQLVDRAFNTDRRQAVHLPRAATAAILLCLLGRTMSAQGARVTPLMTRELADLPGKQALMITVEYGPGQASAPHRHNAHTFVYVLEGSVVMQVKGGQAVTLSPGQTFYEGPDDVHTVSRNASAIKPARLLVIFVKEKDAPVTVPAQGQ
jgi:quercetin dioxygenase-like cupin family protein